MKEKVQKLSNNLNRLLTGEVVSRNIYLCWAISAFLLIGIFGICPFTKELVGKYQIYVQMTKLNKDLSRKVSDISNASEKIKLVSDDILYLDRYLPNDFDTQNYMVDFITASGEAGYYVDTFTPTEGAEGAAEIYISLSGRGDVTQLVKSLESLKRVSEIQDITLSKMGGEDILRLYVKTYIMEKQ